MKSLKQIHEDNIKGGVADIMDTGSFDPKELAKGTKIEMEHTEDESIATEIAMDHLGEDPEYYIKLAKVHTEEMNDDEISESNDDMAIGDIISIKRYDPKSHKRNKLSAEIVGLTPHTIEYKIGDKIRTIRKDQFHKLTESKLKPLSEFYGGTMKRSVRQDRDFVYRDIPSKEKKALDKAALSKFGRRFTDCSYDEQSTLRSVYYDATTDPNEIETIDKEITKDAEKDKKLANKRLEKEQKAEKKEQEELDDVSDTDEDDFASKN